MNPILKNILAVLAGVILGSIVNMGIIMLSSSIIPPPEGVDPSDMESLKSSMHLFEPKHFIVPFLAHALGTLAGAFITALIAVNHKMKLALVIGLFFLLGGISSVFMLPSPTWFIVLDLVVAYIPMAWIGGRLAGQVIKK
jgi:hypothetical protein